MRSDSATSVYCPNSKLRKAYSVPNEHGSQIVLTPTIAVYKILPIRMRTFRTIRTIWGNLILTLVAIGIIKLAIRDLRYYYDDNLVTIKSPAEVAKLRDNMLAEIQLPLAVKDAYWVEYEVSKREFQLIPFQGVGYRLMWVVEGSMTDQQMAGLRPPFKGRVAAKRGTRWNVHDKGMRLDELFAKKQIKLPANTMVIFDAPKEFPSALQLLLAAAGSAYLVWLSVMLFRLVK